MGQGWTHAKARSREGWFSDAISLLRDYGAINNWKALSIHNATALTGATRH